MRGGLLAFSEDDSFQLVGIGVGNMVSLRVPFGVGIAENGQREVGAFVESANANFRYGSGEKDGTKGTALEKAMSSISVTESGMTMEDSAVQ